MQQSKRPLYPFSRARKSPWPARAIWLGGILMVGGLAFTTTRGVDTKESFAGAAMRGDLRALADVEDHLFHDSGKYLTRVPTSLFVGTFGHTAPVIALTSDGWTAQMRNNYSSQICAVFVGSTSQAPAINQREPQCTPLIHTSSPLAANLGQVVALVVGFGLALAGSTVSIRRRLVASAA